MQGLSNKCCLLTIFIVSFFYLQVYRGNETTFTLENLQPKSEYQVRVCAIRLSSDESELYGAYSPGHSFCTASPEPVKPVVARVSDCEVTESKQWTDQQLAAILLTGLMVLAILIAFVAQQFISYTSGSSSG